MRSFVLALLLSCLLGCPAKQESAGVAFVGSDITGTKLDSDFDLADQDGKLRHLSDFKGKLVALFFGYTHCPDVCPTTMAELAKAMKLLEMRGKDVQVLFVTLDPERDTAEVLKRYVPSFNPDFLGLRGDEAATKKVAQDFKIFFARQESNSKAGYTIDHSAGVYVFDRKGDLRLYLNHGQSAKDIAHDFGLLLKE
jgi:protein SCO1/2